MLPEPLIAPPVPPVPDQVVVARRCTNAVDIMVPAPLAVPGDDRVIQGGRAVYVQAAAVIAGVAPTVQLMRVAVPLSARPPPKLEVFPLMVQSLRLATPPGSSYTPPPKSSAELPLTVQPVNVRLPVASTTSPLPKDLPELGTLLPLTVQSVIVAVPAMYCAAAVLRRCCR